MRTRLSAHEKSLAKAAAVKRSAGETPSRAESDALRKAEQAASEKLRWEAFSEIPPTDWAHLAGITTQQLRKQARTYDFQSLAAGTISLVEFVPEFHRFLADNASKIAGVGRSSPEDPLLLGPTSPNLERYRAARAAREELTLARERGEWVQVDEMREGLGIFAEAIARAIGRIERKHGRDAADLLRDALAGGMKACGDRLGGELETPKPRAKRKTKSAKKSTKGKGGGKSAGEPEERTERT
jgi:hypothetical protein